MGTSVSSTQVTVVRADVHKRTHTFVALAEVGRKLAEKVASATRVVFHHLHTDLHDRIQPGQPAAA